MIEKKTILVCNDDGITSKGIKTLIDVCRKLGHDVVVVAPNSPQSGMGHAITINAMLRCEPTNFHQVSKEFSCSGTPVDCVKMAISKLMDKKPDLVVSGINHGSNSSINVIYSGTMSAAIEGAMEGVPSIGFSLLDYKEDADFTAAAHYAEQIIKDVLNQNNNAGKCFNVNIPKLKLEEIKGVKFVRQCKGTWIEEMDERKDPSGKTYYWLTGKFQNFEPESTDTDEWALANNYVSIVPISYDLTNYVELKKLTEDATKA